MKLTPHFTLEELTRTDEKDLKQLNLEEGLKVKDKLVKLAEFAESVRAVLGCPLTVTSGFRCEKLNNRIGGSPTSKHRFCQAVDFIPKNISAFEAFIKILISGLEFHECILEKRGNGHLIHIAIGTKMKKLYSPKAGEYNGI